MRKNIRLSRQAEKILENNSMRVFVGGCGVFLVVVARLIETPPCELIVLCFHFHCITDDAIRSENHDQMPLGGTATSWLTGSPRPCRRPRRINPGSKKVIHESACHVGLNKDESKLMAKALPPRSLVRRVCLWRVDAIRVLLHWS